MSDSVKATLLTAVAVTGAGTAFLYGVPRRIHAMQVSFTGGSPTVVCKLEGTLDGTNWFTLATFDTGAGGQSGDIVKAVDTVVQQVRGDLTTLTGGTNPTVTATLGGW